MDEFEPTMMEQLLTEMRRMNGRIEELGDQTRSNADAIGHLRVTQPPTPSHMTPTTSPQAMPVFGANVRFERPVGLPPSFNGRTPEPEVWFNQINNWLLVNQRVNPAVRGHMIVPSLEGEAFNLVWTSTSEADRGAHDGAKTVIGLLERHFRKSKVVRNYNNFVRLIMIKRGYNESTDSYLRRFEIAKQDCLNAATTLPDELVAYMLLDGAGISEGVKGQILGMIQREQELHEMSVDQALQGPNLPSQIVSTQLKAYGTSYSTIHTKTGNDPYAAPPAQKGNNHKGGGKGKSFKAYLEVPADVEYGTNDYQEDSVGVEENHAAFWQQPKGKGKGKGKGAKGPPVCAFCNRVGHNSAVCYFNPDSPMYQHKGADNPAPTQRKQNL